MKQNNSFPYAFFEGKIIPIQEAKINIMTNALQYGNGIFGGIRGYLTTDKKSAYIFRIDDHYTRFLNSLRILNKSLLFDKEKLIEITKELARKNKPSTDFYLRPFAYASDYELSPDLSKVRFDFAIYMIPLGEYLSISKGLKLAISNWIRISDNMIPSRAKITGGYVNSSLAKGDAARLGFDDCLMLDQAGHITEGSAANFFMYREGKLISSPKHADTLEGITRKTIIELAHYLDIDFEEREIDRTEVFVCNEAFLCGTGVQVAWISEIDGRIIGDGKIGPISKKIQHLFFEIVRGKNKKFFSWLSKI